MLLFIFALTSVASAGELLCQEPDTDYRLPSECPPGQVLHRNVCRSYFELRSEEKACLLSEYPFLTPRVPTDEIICPLREKTSNCSLYRAYTADCFSFDVPSQTRPNCKEYGVEEMYETFKKCAELTDGLPVSGITYTGPNFPVRHFNVIVSTYCGRQCLTGYCPTNRDKCIIWGKINTIAPNPYGGGVLDPVDKLTTFVHGKSANITDSSNFRSILLKTQRVPTG